MTLNNRIYNILIRNEEVDNDILATIITQEVLNSVRNIPLSRPPDFMNLYALGYRIGAAVQMEHTVNQLLSGGE